MLDVAPEMFANEPVPFVCFCHWYVIVPPPVTLAVTLRVIDDGPIVEPTGCELIVMVGVSA